MKKMTDNVIIPEEKELTASDLQELLKLIRNGKPVEALNIAFKYGFITGKEK